MAAKDVAVGERRAPERLLRPHWVELTDRVWTDNVTDKLYEREILSKRGKKMIEDKSFRDRREGAALLLDMMSTRSWSQCVEFAVIVSETVGVKDLGEKLLEDAQGRIQRGLGGSAEPGSDDLMPYCNCWRRRK